MVPPPLHGPYLMGKRLGKGTYGQVFAATRSGSTDRFAMKQIQFHMTDEYLHLFFREISILKSLSHHPGIIKIIDIVVPNKKGTIFLVTELMDSDLRGFVKKMYPDRRVPVPTTRFLFTQIVSAVAFCHSNHVWHRDLKPHNILIDWTSRRIKLSDFGLAKNVTGRLFGPNAKLTHEIVTLWYRAPEVILGSSDYDGSIDVWSLGSILFELYAGKSLFDSKTEIATLMRIFALVGTPTEENCPGCSAWANFSTSFPAWPHQDSTERFKELCSDVPDILPELVSQMLNINGQKRPSPHDLLANEWIGGRQSMANVLN